MANPYFKFKQFTVWHDRCAMKVGTDGVLLGATAMHPDPENALDIGTGTGLVALMLAQRFPGLTIDAIEIDSQAAEQALENVLNSPFASQISITQSALQDFQPKLPYSLMVCNPPFFKVSSRSNSESRNLARQTEMLEPADVFSFARQFLRPEGLLVMIFPSGTDLTTIASAYGLFPASQLQVKGHREADAKRTVWTFGRAVSEVVKTELILEEYRNQYTPAFRSLVNDFYLYV